MKFLIAVLCVLIISIISTSYGEENNIDDQLCPCPRILNPVCASNNKTYSNKCLFECARKYYERTKGLSIKIVKSGRCDAADIYEK